MKEEITKQARRDQYLAEDHEPKIKHSLSSQLNGKTIKSNTTKNDSSGELERLRFEMV